MDKEILQKINEIENLIFSLKEKIINRNDSQVRLSPTEEIIWVVYNELKKENKHYFNFIYKEIGTIPPYNLRVYMSNMRKKGFNIILKTKQKEIPVIKDQYKKLRDKYFT